MFPSNRRCCYFLSMGFFLLGNVVSAIGIRHDLEGVLSQADDNPYVFLGGNFDSVVNITWSNHRGLFQATGSLVRGIQPGQYKILTAAHIVDGNSGTGHPDGLIDAAQYTIEFGDSELELTHRVNVPKADVKIHPRWYSGDPFVSGLERGAAQFDLAVMTFTASDLIFGDATSLPSGYDLWGGNPLNEVATLVGFGRWGLGDDFSNSNGTSIYGKDGIRRAGSNVIDAVDEFSHEPNDGLTIRADFDAPSSFGVSRSVFGFDGPTQLLEASTAKGDSGGPLLVRDNLLVGVLHGGYNPFSDADLSEYGDVGVWASVGDSRNRQFLESNGVAYYEFETYALPAVIANVPEPGNSFSVAICTLALLAIRRRG